MKPAARRLVELAYAAGSAAIRNRLFCKYAALFAVVCLAMVANGLLEIWLSYQDNEALLVRNQREQAAAATEKIGLCTLGMRIGILGYDVKAIP